MPDFYQEALDQFSYSQAIRRDLHLHPELGFQEVRTAGVVARELSHLGLEVTTGVGQTGVVALLEGAQSGPVILLRFDMDALPIVEDTGLDFASLNHGVMHACGHDSHTAVGLTVARLLNAHRAELKGTVKLMFQPAEEGLGGAASMIRDGVLENPAPQKCLALHVWNEQPVGWVGVSDGPVMAGAGSFRIRINGKGGHGAQPQVTRDPVLAGAQIVAALQSIVSRNVSPLKSAVVSVTQFHAGEAFNIIPQYAELGGTIRAFEQRVIDLLIERMDSIVTGVAAAMGCQAELSWFPVTPPVVNDAEVTARVQAVAQSALPGVELATHYQTMGSEDMALVLEKIPGCYFFLGSVEPGQTAYGHHHPKFDIDEQVMPYAAGLMAAAAFDFLS